MYCRPRRCLGTVRPWTPEKNSQTEIFLLDAYRLCISNVNTITINYYQPWTPEHYFHPGIYKLICIRINYQIPSSLKKLVIDLAFQFFVKILSKKLRLFQYIGNYTNLCIAPTLCFMLTCWMEQQSSGRRLNVDWIKLNSWKVEDLTANNSNILATKILLGVSKGEMTGQMAIFWWNQNFHWRK